MAKLFKYCIIVLFIYCSTCFGESIVLSQEKYTILNNFFRILVEESEVGYVLESRKPVCIHGFFNKDRFSVNTALHRHSVALREGARVWQELTTSDPEVMLAIAKKEDPLIPNWIHVMAIHRSLLQDVLHKNMPLFQYVLGPTVSPESLFSAITSDKTTYYSLLKGDKVLIGEILGFGTQNALYISRIENIEEALDQEIPPFLNIQSIVREYANEYLPFEPGFGFDSVETELKALQKKVTFPSLKLVSSNPEFVFGCLKDSKENDRFVAALEGTQNQIQHHLQSKTFLEDTLHKLTGHQYTVPRESKNFTFCFNENELNLAVAKGIWESLQGYDKEYLPCFVSGMQNLNSNDIPLDRAASFPNFRTEIIDAKNNLRYADQLFTSLHQKKDVNCILPGMLYYKTINRSRSNIKCEGSFVSIEVSIFSPSGQCLTHKSHLSVNLKNTIPGFSIGLKGMRIGETREIFIHPCLGYGFDTSLDKCITLRAIVTLQDIYDNHPYSYETEPLDLDFVRKESTLKERTEKYKFALATRGKQIALHLRKCPQIDLYQICSYLNDFQTNKRKFTPTTEEEQTLINHMHWNIYFG